jgi:predicted dehydrogenase
MVRRQFLRRVFVARVDEEQKMDAVRFGVVGVGGMGASHVHEMLKLPEVKLVAGADVREEARGRFQAMHGLPCHESHKELVARDDVDAICVVTPHPSHKEITVDALRAGKHVLVEKPISSHVKDADEMIACAREAGKKLGVVFQMRFNPLLREGVRIVHSGELGDLLRISMIARHLRTQAYYRKGSRWRGTWRGEGGGLLLNQAPHALDFFLWLGGMPVRVWGLTGTRMHEMETEDEASALLEYPNGSHGAIQANTFEGPDGIELQVHGTRGRLIYDSAGLRLMTPAIPIDDFIAGSTSGMDTQKYETRSMDLRDASPHQETLRDFALAIIEDRPSLVPGEEGLKSLELANAIVLSSEREKCITLPIDRDEYAALLAEKIRLNAEA